MIACTCSQVNIGAATGELVDVRDSGVTVEGGVADVDGRDRDGEFAIKVEAFHTASPVPAASVPLF